MTVLDEVESFLSRFVAYPSEAARIAHTLWIAHTHLITNFDSTPRLAFLSPEPGSGKSRALEVTEPLVPRPVHSVNASPAYLFRKVSDPEGLPTILFDEADTVFGAKAKDNEDVRAMLNAGHRKGATAGRCVIKGAKIETEELPSYCAVALAGLGDLPDTIMTRAVVVRMRRRAPGEHVEPRRDRIGRREGGALGGRLATWAQSVSLDLDGGPTMPEGIADRNADVWESLLLVAEAVGDGWPERARAAAVELVTEAQGDRRSLGSLLLHDLRTVFTVSGLDAMSTDAILGALHALDESPWNDLHGKPLDSRIMAKYLAKYRVEPKVLRFGERTHRGYERAALSDPWSRYLAPINTGPDVTDTPGNVTSSPTESTPDVTSVTPVTVLRQSGEAESYVHNGPLWKIGDKENVSQESASDPASLRNCVTSETDVTHAEAEATAALLLGGQVESRLDGQGPEHTNGHAPGSPSMRLSSVTTDQRERTA